MSKCVLRIMGDIKDLNYFRKEIESLVNIGGLKTGGFSIYKSYSSLLTGLKVKGRLHPSINIGTYHGYFTMLMLNDDGKNRDIPPCIVIYSNNDGLTDGNFINLWNTIITAIPVTINKLSTNIIIQPEENKIIN